MCDICRRGGIFKSSGDHVITSLYKLLMTIMILSSDKGFQNDKHYTILSCELENITDYIYRDFFYYETIIGVTPLVLPTKCYVCLYSHCIILYIFLHF